MASELCAGQVVGKYKWPELVGVQGSIAKNTIDRQNPRVTAVILLVGSPVTKDINCERVRVWVDTNGVVVEVPSVN